LLRSVLQGVKKVDDIRLYYMWASLAVFVANILLVLLYGDPVLVGPGSSALFCRYGTVDQDIRFYTNTLPRSIYFGIAAILVFHSIYFCIRTSLRVSDKGKNPIIKIWKSYSMLFMFFALYMVIYPITIFYYEMYIPFAKNDKYTDGAVDWVICLITHFTSTEQNTSVEDCGSVPAVRSPVGMYIQIMVIDIVLVIMFLYLTINADVKAFYWNKFVWVLEQLHLKDQLDKLLKYTGGTFALKAVAKPKESVMSSSNESENDADSEQQSANKTKPVVAVRAGVAQLFSGVAKVLPSTEEDSEAARDDQHGGGGGAGGIISPYAAPVPTGVVMPWKDAAVGGAAVGSTPSLSREGSRSHGDNVPDIEAAGDIELFQSQQRPRPL
jgi:hypothetical protein